MCPPCCSSDGLSVTLFFSLVPPKFTQIPARVSVVCPGQSKVFECQVTGTPEIDIYWFKEGSEISPTDHYKMAFVNSVATLEVCGAEVKHSGLYYCEARNEAGSESCSMELKVKGVLNVHCARITKQWFPSNKELD